MTREARPFEHHGHEVLADVVDIALDGADDDGPEVAGVTLGETRLEKLEGALHGARAQQYFGNEALTVAHALTDDVHAGQQAAIQDLAGAGSAVQQPLGKLAGTGSVSGDDRLLETFVRICHRGSSLPSAPLSRR